MKNERLKNKLTNDLAILQGFECFVFGKFLYSFPVGLLTNAIC